MNGPMLDSNQRYQESLKNMLSPVFFSQLPKVKMNLRGLSRYAKEKGVRVAELSEEFRRVIDVGKIRD